MSDVHDMRLYKELNEADKSLTDAVGNLRRAMRLLGEMQHHIERLETLMRLLEAKLKGVMDGSDKEADGSTEAV